MKVMLAAIALSVTLAGCEPRKQEADLFVPLEATAKKPGSWMWDKEQRGNPLEERPR